MNSKEALKELSMMINREKHINSDWNKKIDKLKNIIEKDLEILDLQRLIQKNALEKIREEGMEEMELPKAPNTFEALNYLELMANKYQMIRYPGISNLTIDGYCEQIKQSLERLDKYENAIDKVIKLPDCDICDSNWHNGCMCLKNKIKEVLNYE